ncbi:hypothetical protein GCM10028800_21400 [Nesterenkonia populi]
MCVLGDIPASPRSESSDYMVVCRKGGNDQDGKFGHFFQKRLGGGDAVLAGEINIHHDDIWAMRPDLLYCFNPVVGLSCELKVVRRFNVEAQCFPHHGLVFNYKNANHGASCSKPKSFCLRDTRSSWQLSPRGDCLRAQSVHSLRL